jgi:hypothetical protein
MSRADPFMERISIIRIVAGLRPALSLKDRAVGSIAEQDCLIPCLLEPDGSSKAYRKNWARLIRKIYEVDPLTCPNSGTTDTRIFNLTNFQFYLIEYEQKFNTQH